MSRYQGQGFERDVVIVGGCGHVGLPLAISFADRGASVAIYDVDTTAVELVNAGRMPFAEPDAEPALERVIAAGRLTASTDPATLGTAEHVVVVIGTPVERGSSPDLQTVPQALAAHAGRLRDGQLLVLRSTVQLGVTALVEKTVSQLGHDIDVVFCPERIAEGRAMAELPALPQIIGARTQAAASRAGALFGLLTDALIRMTPEEAELAKLFSNAWRYVKFAVANQFFMIANDRGLDYERVRRGLTLDYPRAADVPPAGFAAGPCLLKDTMLLAASSGEDFSLGHAAMEINEGLPRYVVDRLTRRFDLGTMTVGILGMAFKGGSDDIRASLAYELKRVLLPLAGAVCCTDPYVTADPSLVALEEAIERSDLLVIAAPHPEYRNLSTTKPVVDIWGILDGSVWV